MYFEKPKVRPDNGKFLGFDRVLFWVGNAKQAASFYTSRFGFEYYAYRGLETGERNICSHVIKSNKIIFEFQSAYEPKDTTGISKHVSLHGDGVRDISFKVEDCIKTFNYAKKQGAKIV